MNIKSTRGSEWRKWDLHVHTPASDGTGTPEEIVNTAIAKGISVIAITDHHTTDYIDKVKEAAKNTTLSVISGIEFRSEYGARSVHFIAYFPDEYNGIKLTSQILDDLVLCKLSLSKAEIIHKGKEQNSNLSDESAFKTGIFLLQVEMKKACDLIHSLGGLIAVHNGYKSNGLDSEVKHLGKGVSNVRILDECLGPLKEDLMKNYIDICDLGLSDEQDERSFYLSSFNTPSILASDAHEYSKIGDSYTWIKANTTFEGLKQICFEPESRVSFKEPKFLNSYQVIDSISFNNEEMGRQEIRFNQNLNTIIGGRSSGKSILLGCLGLLVEPSLKPKEREDDYNKNIKKLIEKATLKWKDGSSDNRKIIYFSQSKISEIVRPNENGISGINDLVEKIVKTDEKKNTLIQQYEKAIIANRTELVSKINDFCEINKQIIEKKQQISDIGNKKGIILEIEKINNEINEIKKNLDNYLSNEEDLKFNEKKEILEKLLSCKDLISSDISQFQIAKNAELFASQDSLFSSFSTLSNDTILKFYEELKKETTSKWCEFIDNQINQFTENSSKTCAKINEIENSSLYKKGIKYQINHNSLFEKEQLLNNEKTKRKEIEKIETELEKLQISLKENREKILNTFNKYKTLATELSKELYTQKKEVIITANVQLLYNEYFDHVLEIINKKVSKDKHNYEDFRNETSEIREQWLNDIFNGILDGNLQLKKQYTLHQALTDLFSNNFWTISYNVTYDNDSFKQMSEGKKAYIVLRLLLDFDESECPIIIDQPEDDLDNRAIYEQLVSYLREQKINRQIILATHNPNIVVGADAELVIVANQNGIDSPNHSDLQFEYYGNGIEDTFTDDTETAILAKKGIREHICEILEGGNTAFQLREKKYGYKSL